MPGEHLPVRPSTTQEAIASAHAKGPTIGWTDTREPDMSLTEPATQTDADARPGRGTGELIR